jgi:hypothetical protein
MREAVKKVALLLGSTLAVLLVCELGWRAHLYRSGRGFFDDPCEFTSPFFTTYAEPVPYVANDLLYYLNEHVPRSKPSREMRVKGGLRRPLPEPGEVAGPLAQRGLVAPVEVASGRTPRRRTPHPRPSSHDTGTLLRPPRVSSVAKRIRRSRAGDMWRT